MLESLLPGATRGSAGPAASALREFGAARHVATSAMRCHHRGGHLSHKGTTNRSLTASRASSTTPAPCCPASCGCWRNWRSGTTCPPAGTRASTTSGQAQESRDSARREAFRARLRTDLTHLFGLLSDGVLTAKIAARYPLADVAAAMNWPSPPAAPPSARSSWCPDSGPRPRPPNHRTGRNPAIRQQSQRARAGSATRQNSHSRAERTASRPAEPPRRSGLQEQAIQPGALEDVTRGAWRQASAAPLHAPRSAWGCWTFPCAGTGGSRDGV
jgi:hypothetical protein